MRHKLIHTNETESTAKSIALLIAVNAAGAIGCMVSKNHENAPFC